MQINIRQATKTDLSEVRELVVELAIYEKEPNAVEASLNDYVKSFEEGILKIIIATNDHEECIGMCLGYITFSTWKGKMLYLEDFVVKEKYRGTGVGVKLFEAYKKYAVDLNCNLMKWQVLDWNSPAINFYKKQGAIIETNWWSVRLFLNEPSSVNN
jgi:GNAT superfamily N-acetyltransferase